MNSRPVCPPEKLTLAEVPPMPRMLTCTLLAVLAIHATGFCAELLPPETAVERVIDTCIQEKLSAKGLHSSPIGGDSTLIRRMTLDLAGRIPTLTEAQSFVASTEPDKRAKLVERLMSSPDFAFQFRNSLDTLLMAGHGNSPGEWRDYLLKSIRANRSWDQLFREMMVGDEEDPDVKPALTFLRVRARDLDQLTNDCSMLFFGVNVSCAKCHDHPLVEDWKQDHYFGMASFFQRTYVTRKNLIAEKYSGEVKFKTTKGEDKVARLMFLSGAVVDEPAITKTEEQKKQENEAIQKQMQDEKAGPPPRPEFSPRAKLVELALQPDNERFFSRNIVNRVWALYFGRGLVHPLDQMHSANPASHPELLEWLSQDLIAHHYDLMRLVKGIVSSDAYARSSLWESASEAPSPEYFARAVVRPLSARQYSLSLRIASANPETFMPTSSPDWPKRRDDLERQAEGLAHSFEVPGENFQIGVDEALLFTNGPQMWNEFARGDGDGLAHCLKQKPDAPTQIDTAYWTVFSRPPLPEERADCEQFLTKHSTDQIGGLRQLVWSLLASPEIRFID